MKKRVAKAPRQPIQTRSIMRVTLDSEQLELIEKLSLFYTRKLNKTVSKNHIIEKAVRIYTDESIDSIHEMYDFDIRSVTLTEMQQFQSCGNVKVAAFDTVILPAKDNEECKQALFVEHAWYPIQLCKEKLAHMQYIAFYIGAPCSGITHYARISWYEAVSGMPEKHILRFEPPIELPCKLCLGSVHAAAMRKPRYTTLSLLLEARTIEDLF